ncbi:MULTISPECIES: hypothetical protein [Variovorax]|uniref:hypothetical protein n=1 Tax=Variovorax TaxID=34072 RepID=UPI00285DE54F|nr:hypothetical protein [Variovorax sp. 3319]MDR6890887.1 hypothetical protein [Variovorax sp. 3319]
MHTFAIGQAPNLPGEVAVGVHDHVVRAGGLGRRDLVRRRHAAEQALAPDRMPLLFLLRLLHVQLPLRMVDPEDIRAVSVLTATGLIEVEIKALASTGRYAAPRAVTVTRIKEASFAELAKMWDPRVHEKGTGQTPLA